MAEGFIKAHKQEFRLPRWAARNGPAGEFTEEAPAAPSLASGSAPQQTRASSGRETGPGAALVGQLGLSSFLLLVAVGLIAASFKRRRLALVVAMFGAVLYVAALDRAALAVHVSHLSRPTASIEDRVTACRQAKHTFFYRETALREMEAAAKDAGTPEPVRLAAEESVKTLQGKPWWQK